MSIAVLINPRSGSVPADAPDLIRARLEELGETCEVILLDKEDICSPIDRCFETSPDVVVAWGGDGTVACALDRAGHEGPPVLPLPGGTMNLLHKQIHGGACEWEECLTRGLTVGRRIEVPAGCAGDRRFFVAAMAGNLTALTEPRESLRKGHVLEAIEKLSGSDVLDLHTSMTFRSADGENGTVEGFATAAAIFVGHEPDTDFEFAYIDPDNPLELAAAGLGALLSNWREASGVTILQTPSVELFDRRGHDLRVTLDGEPVRLKSGTRFCKSESVARAISAECE